MKYILLLFIAIRLNAQNNYNELKIIIWDDFLTINSAYVDKPKINDLDLNLLFDESIKINKLDSITINKFVFYKANITINYSFNFIFDKKKYDFYIIKNIINNDLYKFNGFYISDFWVWEKKLVGHFYNEDDFYNFLLKSNFWSKDECKKYSKYFKKPFNKKCKGLFFSNFMKELFPKNAEIYSSIMLFPYEILQ